ncbi:DUF1439 domain-containing protein [Bisgaard Taxon 10/6]|uniref:DUF1439 domain-containing protein n=1 Tax=Exercitatus varius TaxID=67857 RepID=A0AAW6QDE6_9PAST|nr:DUF1439 domain-containing protein [Exercitatus varius]QOF68833.1 DUF1439 domain-containing protein [Actinobacillus sp. GY-402]MDG2915105.1 DUF1439 domain-containing protein [Exercitatus varius]MDG2916447.1 DUF1439 domain-containing protein [Exercitatus varius]MDG2940313.1 DUF1439 domain-containing protein [Exercitatus varius]MDG2942548.1 DUF1439 domain-containing protein [Exercitatus varius]
MKKFIRLFLLSLCCFPLFTQAFSISEEEINAYLAKKSDISDKVGFPGLFSLDYKLQDLTTKIGQNDKDRVEISGIVDGILGIQQKQMAGKLAMTIDTIPYYDAEKGSVYLKDIRILKWSGEPDSYMQQLQGVMPFISQSVAALMSTIPIYTLDDTKPRDVLIKTFAKGIRVEKGRLALDAGVL